MNDETDEYYKYENILERMLSRVPDDIDKREGSIIYDAVAPAAMEIAQMYVTLKNSFDLIFVDTSVGEYLDRIANQVGITRNEGTKAIRKGLFKDAENTAMDIPLNSRFTIGDLVFKAIEKISLGQYKMECETIGIVGNNTSGSLIPIDYIQDLAVAVLDNILIPGEDEESDEDLRERYIESVTSPAFAGNITDYRMTVKDIDGVGDLKVIPVWNGGGTVKLILLDSTYGIPTANIIENVQNEVFPQQGDNIGIAPIGHDVTVVAASPVTINVNTTITLQEGYTLESIIDNIVQAVQNYLFELRRKWASSDNIIVRVSQLETKILGVDGVLDIENTSINSQDGNIQLEFDEVPILGEVVVE